MATKYQPLIDHLTAITEREIILTFAEIEAIVGFPLAVSMQLESASWNGLLNPHVRALRATGWRAQLARRNRCVVFTRDAGEGPR